MPQLSFWKLLGGVLGAGFVFTTVFLAPKIGIGNMLFFIIIGQLLTAATIDHFGLLGMNVRPLSPHQILGLIIMACGLGVYFFGGKWFQAA